MKFELVFVTVAVAEVDDPLRDFTNNCPHQCIKKEYQKKGRNSCKNNNLKIEMLENATLATET